MLTLERNRVAGFTELEVFEAMAALQAKAPETWLVLLELSARNIEMPIEDRIAHFAKIVDIIGSLRFVRSPSDIACLRMLIHEEILRELRIPNWKACALYP